MQETLDRENRKRAVLCAVTAVGVLTFCTRSSFLFPLNNWVDSNCFFTVGKGMMNGLVPYRDLLEQKGPLLYMLHALAWLISHDSFFGVYLLEIAAAFGFLYFSCRSLQLYVGRAALYLIPLIALLTYTCLPFVHGDSAEEFALPLVAWDLWLALRAAREGKTLSWKTWMAVGLRAGCVFWIKFTLVGAYVGLFLAQAVRMLWEKRPGEVIRAVGAVAAGVLVSTLPHLLYFGWHGAIRDWFQVYLYYNLFLYGGHSRGLLSNFVTGLYSLYWYFRLNGILCLLGALWLLKKERYSGWTLFLSAAFSFLFVYVGGRSSVYYAFLFCVYVPFGLGALVALAQRLRIHTLPGRELVLWGLTASCIVASSFMSNNRDFRNTEPMELPQFQFKAIIEEKENPTLLNYGFLDGGFYTVTNIVPTCRAFCELNLPLEEMYALQDACVEQGQVDFVVTRDEAPELARYEIVAQGTDGTHSYYLYQCKE